MSFFAFPSPSTIELCPIDGTTDDATRLNAALTVAGLTGGAVRMLPGLGGRLWQIKSTIQTPNNVVILGTPDTVVKQTLPNTGFNYTFGCNGAPVTGPNLGVPNDIQIGVGTITLTTAPAIGNWVALADSATNIGLMFQVINVTGTGPFTVTLDRPIRYSFAHATSTAVIVSGFAQNVRVFGNGMTISGTGISYVAFSQSVDIVVEDLILNSSQGALAGTSGSLWMLFDSFALRCRARNNQIVGTRTFSAGDTGMFWAGTEGCVSEGNRIFGIATGVEVDYSTDFISRNNGVYKCQNGLEAQNRNSGCRFIGDRYSGNSSTGVSVNSGTSYRFEGVECNYNGSDGININNNFSHGTADVAISGGDYSYNAAAGLHVTTGVNNVLAQNVTAVNNENAWTTDSGAHGVFVRNIDMSNGGGGAIARLFGETWLDGFTATCSSTITLAVNAPAGTTVSVKNGYINTFGAAGLSTFGRVVADNLHITLQTAVSTGITQNSGVLIVDNITVDGSGATAGSGIGSAVGGTLRAGKNLHLDAAANGLNAYYTGGIFVSRGNTVVVNGTTAVFVSWPDLQKNDVISFLAPTTIGGTVGAVPKAVYTTSPSVGFNVTATAGDTSTYPYVIR